MMKNKVIITGGTGLLGKALIDCNPGYQITATYVGNYDYSDPPQAGYIKLDVNDQEGCDRLFAKVRPDVLIHTASIGSPDYAEQHKELTWQINVEGTKRMLSLCEKYTTKFIFISSNGIYDGDHAPYGEEDAARPLNYYGATKLEGENIARQAKVPYAIVRPILMYGWHNLVERGNIVTTALAKIRKGEKMFAYDDVFSNALLSDCCAKAIWKLIEKEKYTDFNIAGSERVSIFGLIKAAAEIFALNPDLVIPVKQGYFNELVPRPIDTSYNTSKMEQALGIKPLSISEGLEKMKRSQ